jgi:hypothetical protein
VEDVPRDASIECPSEERLAFALCSFSVRMTRGEIVKCMAMWLPEERERSVVSPFLTPRCAG